MSKTRIKLDIPYFSQWESPELVQKVIKKKISAHDDPNWRESGAQSSEEYEHWSWHICGLACLKMILKKETGETYKTMDLVKKALQYSCLDTEKGLYYRPFCIMIKEQFNLEANFTEELTIKKIQNEVSRGNYVITSVHGSIREEELNFDPLYKGGHLVLITGFDQKQKLLSFHDPSGYFETTQQNREISEQDFMRFSPGRGIIIKRKNSNE